MRKVFTLLCCFLLGGSLWAQHTTNATVDSANIRYWVGSGNHYAILAVNWGSPNVALAWGYRFQESSTTVQAAMDSIAAADDRFFYTAAGGFLSDIFFVTGIDTLKLTTNTPDYNFWWSQTNGTGSAGLSATLQNGDVAKWGDAYMGIPTGWDTSDYGIYPSDYAFPTGIVGVSEPGDPIDATIDASRITYWAGEGSHSVVVAVNWANTCLAWGYHFNSTNTTLQEAMDAITAMDSRLSYSTDTSYGYVSLSDIVFIEGTDTLKLSTVTEGYNFWWSNVNGTSSMGLGTNLTDGDFAKWGDALVGIATDTMYGYPSEYAWLIPVVPATEPMVTGPFCGAVGTEGCEAIAANSSSIVAWAVTCQVERGWQDIATQTARVTYGADSMAVGPVDINDNLTVVSLGDGGTATLTFASPITNGEGYDFCVFENSFNDTFLELAFVEVSSDGEHFVRFPATSLTQTRTQISSEVDPTFINNLAGKYRNGYGTPFDLNELADSSNIDITNITHVRIVDVVGSIDPAYGTYDAFGHIVNDPYPTDSYSGGFDLAGVGVMHQKTSSIAAAERGSMAVYPNPAQGRVNVRVDGLSGSTTLRVYDMRGSLLMESPLTAGTNSIDVSQLTQGVYILQANGITSKLVVK